MEITEEKPEKRAKDDEKPHIVVRNAADYQRLKLEKLMKNPDKPVLIPERPKEKGAPHVPDFVRNVMGSSAGAGSGEFHVYRHLRRKEYARQKYMQEKASRDDLDVEYQKKLEENRKKAEEKTAKKRAKRLKKKQKQKNYKRKPGDAKKQESSSSESSEESEKEDGEKDSKEEEGRDKQKVSKKDIENLVETENGSKKSRAEEIKHDHQNISKKGSENLDKTEKDTVKNLEKSPETPANTKSDVQTD